MYLVFLLVSFFASVVGSICGIGGGVIIKPVLDATGVMGVSSISFLSGCTVLSMSIISVFKTIKKKDSFIELETGTPLAIGASIGGILGKDIFQYAYTILLDQNKVGAIQAIFLVLITLGTLIYTINTSKVCTLQVKNIILCITIGLLLGLMSAFLGIGGGPINLVVLFYFFSMDTKAAAINSLYIIMFSQFTSLAYSIVTNSIPEYPIIVLVLMVFGGVFGGLVGSTINNKISEKLVNKLFITLMVVIILINIYNAFKFSL